VFHLDEGLPTLENTTMTEYVQLALAECLIAICAFDLWMSKGARNIFVVIVNFLSTNWEPKHITIGLFDANDMNSVTMAMKLKHILDKFAFMLKIVAYVKDEGSNLQTCVQTLKVLWCLVVILTQLNHLMAIVLGMRCQRYANMPILMTRWFTSYNMHQSNMPKLTFRIVSHGRRNPTKGGKSGRRRVWISTLTSTN
jgi:hypothetical protein